MKQTPPKVVLKSLNQPQLGLAKSPSMMVPVMLPMPITNAPPTTTETKTKRLSPLTRSISVPGGGGENDETQNCYDDFITKNNVNIRSNGENKLSAGSKVSVPKVDDDETFSNFFTSIHKTVLEEGVEIADFDVIKSSEK